MRELSQGNGRDSTLAMTQTEALAGMITGAVCVLWQADGSMLFTLCAILLVACGWGQAGSDSLKLLWGLSSAGSSVKLLVV